MPHLNIYYSANLNARADMDGLCAALADEIAAIGLYPAGGIRVRAICADHVAIADQHPDNIFIDMVFRIGSGRQDCEKTMTGERLMARAKAQLATELADEIANGHFMLSLEIKEIDPVFSWKENTVHQRLQQRL